MANYVSQFTGREIDDAIANHVPKTRTINNKELDNDINLTASDVGAVPRTRKINNKELSNDINVTASDVGAMQLGHVGSNFDLNSLVDSGCYRFDTSCANRPSDGVNYGQILVIRGASDTLAQIIFRYDTNQAWIRTGQGYYGDYTQITWKAWAPIFTPNEPIILNSANYGASDPPANKPIGFVYFKKVT